MNNICKKCGGRCCHTVYIPVYPKDVIFRNNTLVCPGDRDGEKQMILIDDTCIALKNGKCSIYPKRPYTCRVYKC